MFAPGDIAQHLRKSIAEHEMRLLAYRQNAQHIPVQGQYPKDGKRPNPYASTQEEDPYFALITRFAIDFEKTYLHWLYDALETLEQQRFHVVADDQRRDEGLGGHEVSRLSNG